MMKEVFDFVTTDKKLHAMIISNINECDMDDFIPLLIDQNAWEVISEQNPIGSQYDFDFYNGFEDIKYRSIVAVAWFLPDDYEDSMGVYFYDDGTYETHWGGGGNVWK